jgi:hypothetical protein
MLHSVKHLLTVIGGTSKHSLNASMQRSADNCGIRTRPKVGSDLTQSCTLRANSNIPKPRLSHIYALILFIYFHYSSN